MDALGLLLLRNFNRISCIDCDLVVQASATRPSTGSQSPTSLCEKSRTLGYQGLPSRPTIQRQFDGLGRSAHTGIPKAPARWTVELSTEITRSKEDTKAAKSSRSSWASDSSKS